MINNTHEQRFNSHPVRALGVEWRKSLAYSSGGYLAWSPRTGSRWTLCTVQQRRVRII